LRRAPPNVSTQLEPQEPDFPTRDPLFGHTWSNPSHEYAAIRAHLVASRPSGGRDVARSLGDPMIVHLEQPGGALLVPTFPRLDQLTLNQVFDQLPDDVAVRAEHDVGKRSIAEELGQTLEAVPLFERRRRFDLEAAGTREWFDGLRAPQVWAREDVGDSKRLEDRNELLGLLLSFVVQRPETVVARPVAAAPRLRVAHDIKRPQVRASSRAGACGRASSRPCATSRARQQQRCLRARSARRPQKRDARSPLPPATTPAP